MFESKKYPGCDVGGWENIVDIACGSYHTVGLRSDGTLVATDTQEEDGRTDVSDWRDIVAVACGGIHTAGLQKDGRVVATRADMDDIKYDMCKVADWQDIIAIACGSYHTVGLRADGTVVAAGDNDSGQCRVEAWRDIVKIACGEFYTAGVRADGTVVIAGARKEFDKGQYDVSGWREIGSIACARTHTVGLQKNGCLVATGSNLFGECDVSDWNGKDPVKEIFGGYLYAFDDEDFPYWEDYTLGITESGRVKAVGGNRELLTLIQEWSGIKKLASGTCHIVGLREDGTVVAVGRHKFD